MGVLEDAIREHIELRRRHGAAEGELRDQEAEALGPVRREVDGDVDPAEEAARADASVEPADEPVPLAESEPEEPEPEEPEPEVPFDEVGEREPGPVASLDPDEPSRAVPLEEPVTEMGSSFEEPFGDEPPGTELSETELSETELSETELPPEGELPPAEELPRAEEPLPEELPPEELPPEEDPPPADAPPPAGAGADDDVLEETPDFLSETPEHDRLWFEQKPPRDFDFD